SAQETGTTRPKTNNKKREIIPMRTSNKANVVLWILQGLLALFFALASGAPKLLLPMEMLPMPLPLPEGFIRFIGTAEVLGALGLILPGVTHVRTARTPPAALG